MKQKRIFFFFCMIFVAKVGFSKNLCYYQDSTLRKTAAKQQQFITEVERIQKSGIISPNLYYQHLGWMCKQEIRLEKNTGIPIKLRLGSYNYCNWLEGKKNTGLFY